MIHLVWHGKGWCVPAATFGCSLLAEIMARESTHDEGYYQQHGLPICLAFLVSGIIIFSVFLRSRKVIRDEDGRVLEIIDPKWIDNSFFFISIKIWAVIMPAIGILLLVYHGI